MQVEGSASSRSGIVPSPRNMQLFVCKAQGLLPDRSEVSPYRVHSQRMASSAGAGPEHLDLQACTEAVLASGARSSAGASASYPPSLSWRSSAEQSPLTNGGNSGLQASVDVTTDGSADTDTSKIAAIDACACRKCVAYHRTSSTCQETAH